MERDRDGLKRWVVGAELAAALIGLLVVLLQLGLVGNKTQPQDPPLEIIEAQPLAPHER